MDGISNFQRRDARRLSGQFHQRNIRCDNGVRCTKQHYFPHDANFCRSTRTIPPIMESQNRPILRTPILMTAEPTDARRSILAEPKKCVLTVTPSKYPAPKRFTLPEIESEQPAAGLMTDDIPPRCSSPKPFKAQTSTFANQNDERTYVFWVDDFSNNVGPIASSNGIVANAASAPWLPRFTYVCLMQPSVRTIPKPTPKPTIESIPPTNSPPRAFLSYLQRAVIPAVRSTRKVSPTKQATNASNIPPSKKEEEIERRLSSAFQNLNLNARKSVEVRSVPQEENVDDRQSAHRKLNLDVGSTETSAQPREDTLMMSPNNNQVLGNFERRSSIRRTVREPSVAYSASLSNMKYTQRYIAQSRIFPELLAPAQTAYFNSPEHLIVNQLPNSYDQFCETVQYRQVPTVCYNRPINVNGNVQIW